MDREEGSSRGWGCSAPISEPPPIGCAPLGPTWLCPPPAAPLRFMGPGQEQRWSDRTHVSSLWPPAHPGGPLGCVGSPSGYAQTYPQPLKPRDTHTANSATQVSSGLEREQGRVFPGPRYLGPARPAQVPGLLLYLVTQSCHSRERSGNTMLHLPVDVRVCSMPYYSLNIFKYLLMPDI